MTGLVFGKRVVIGLENLTASKSMWLARCDCGSLGRASIDQLRKYSSCGHDKHGLRPVTDLTGHRFGNLTVVAFAGNVGGARWICKCCCGQHIERAAGNLQSRYKPNQSCGCARTTRRDWGEQPLGDVPDEEIARRLGCSKTPVVKARRRAGIAPGRRLQHVYQGRCPCGVVFRRVSASPVRFCSKACGHIAAYARSRNPSLVETMPTLRILRDCRREILMKRSGQ